MSAVRLHTIHRSPAKDLSYLRLPHTNRDAVSYYIRASYFEDECMCRCRPLEGILLRRRPFPANCSTPKITHERLEQVFISDVDSDAS